MSDAHERLAQADEASRARAFISLFQHPSQGERHRALSEVVEMGEAAVESLLDALSSEERFVRQGALRALTQIASPRAASRLQAFVLEAASPLGDDRTFAMQALAAAASPSLGDRSEALAFFTGRLKDEDDFVRAYALEALGRLGDPRARPLLERGARDRDPFVAEKAAAALVRLEQTEVAPSLEEMLSPEAIEHGLQSREASRREMALRELRRRIDELDFDPLPLVVRLIHGPNRIGRRSALEAVARLDLQDARGPVLTLLNNDHTDADILANALRAMASLGVGEGSDRLMARAQQFLGHEDLFVRAAAVASLAAASVDDALPALIVALSDSEAWVREEASKAVAAHAGPALETSAEQLTAVIVLRVRSLQQKVQGRRPAGEVQTLERLVGALASTVPHGCSPRLADEMAPAGYACLAAPAASVRLAGLDLLHELVTSGAKPAPPTRAALRNLAAALSSGDTAVVAAALAVLGAVLPAGSPDATKGLIEVLHRGQRALALDAIDLLGRAGDPQAQAVLEKLVRNPDAEISRAAESSLPETDGWDDF